MGLRGRNSRNKRRRQQERAKRRKQEMLSHARPKCPLCETALCTAATPGVAVEPGATDIQEIEVWRCFRCRSVFLRMGDELLPEITGSPVSSAGEGARKAA